ncbi:MAG: hypothetical protein IIC75_08460 [Bacteroidetes bacterium]|nr:hypothetical protein [Bacteroidota bacterium]
MSIIKKIFQRKPYSDKEIKSALENVAKVMHKNCIADAKQTSKKLKSYDTSKSISSNLNLEELMSYVIFSNSLGLDTFKIRIQEKYYLFISLKTMWLLKQNSGLDKSLYDEIPVERFQDGNFTFVHRLDEYFEVLKKSKPIEMGAVNVSKLALKNIYGDDDFVDLERTKILVKPYSNLRDRYKDVPFVKCLV